MNDIDSLAFIESMTAASLGNPATPEMLALSDPVQPETIPARLPRTVRCRASWWPLQTR